MYENLPANLLLLALVIAFTLRAVCNRQVTMQQRAVIFYIWLVSFLPFAFIPIEIDTLMFARQEDEAAAARASLVWFWKVYYWANLVNGWVVLPLWLGYLQSGYFTTVDRLKDSLAFNLKFYLALAFLLSAASVIFVFSYDRNTSQMLVESHLLVNSLCPHQLLPALPRVTQLRALQVPPGLPPAATRGPRPPRQPPPLRSRRG